MLTDEEMLNTVNLNDMWLDFFMVIQSNDFEVVTKDEIKRHITIKTS